MVVDRYQDENTEFMPQSPYAVAKLAAHNMVRIYREGYGLHAGCGILFNHESERRGENFVTRKITKWLGEYKVWAETHGVVNPTFSEDYIHYEKESFPKLRLGNIKACRDWGHAADYVEAMWLMTQQDSADDYVISTGETYSVHDFLTEAFNVISISDYDQFIVIDPKFYRPAEVEYLKGRSDKAKEVLGWTPKISFKELVKRMVWSDINGKKEKVHKLQKEEL